MLCARVAARLAAFGLVVLVSSSVPATGAQAPLSDGVLSGAVTSQGGAIALPGAVVVVQDARERKVATEIAGGDGRFSILHLTPGRYRIEATLEGFRAAVTSVDVERGRAVEVRLDLDVSAAEQTVVVSERPTAISVSSPSSRSESVEARTIDEVDGFRDALRLLAGVFQTPSGLSIKGGRPTQSSLLLGGANVTDLASGAASFRLPADAVQSVDVLPNPYSVEFGRFSSGVTVLETRHGDDTWRTRLNNFIPSLRTKREQPLTILGVERFGPRLFVGGPILKDRLFLSQSAEYRYEAITLWSRPETDIKRSHVLNAFSRLDANVTGANRLKVSFNVLAQNLSAVNLDAFTSPDAAARINERVGNVVVSDTTVVSDAMMLDSMVQGSRYNAHVEPSGAGGAGMDIAPYGNSGRFFYSGSNRTGAYQWAESLSRFVRGRTGEHFFKVGVDLLHTTFDGTGESAPVTIRRVDGTIARRLTFSGPATEQLTTTDVAVFAQDRWQPWTRVLLEAGARFDRDGGVDRANNTARAGGVLALTKTGTRVIRGGIGLFYERTPSIVGAFEQFEAATDTRFAADGVTMIGAPAILAHRTDGPLETPRSLTWNVGYEHQTQNRLFWRLNYLERDGRREFLVEPVSTLGGTELVLSSRGRSHYREIEFSAKYAVGDTFQVDASFARSAAVGDLNAYASYFGALRSPFVTANDYARLDVDVPHRLVARVRYAPGPRWVIAPVIEFRNGTPYSAVDEFLDIVPALGRSRFPNVTMVDVRVDRRVKILKWQPWVGVRVYNALNAFDPSDVQRNLTSSQYGGFFGGRPRQIRLQLRFN